MLGSERVTAPLSLTRKGSGEPLLLLHGLGTSCRDFTAVLPELTDRFDVINVDLPGIGRSPHLAQRPTVAAITDAVEHTLDAEGLGGVHVLGNSLGARIGLELAVRGRARSVPVSIAPTRSLFSGRSFPAKQELRSHRARRLEPRQGLSSCRWRAADLVESTYEVAEFQRVRLVCPNIHTV